MHTENIPINSALSDLSKQLGVPEVTLVSVLRLFYDQYHSLPVVFNQFIKQQDWLAMQSMVHKVKGACGSLQMNSLRNQLVAVEVRLKQGQTIAMEDLQPFFNELQQVIDLYQLNTDLLKR